MKCLLYQSSNFNHLWRNSFLSFNKLFLCYLFLFIFMCEAFPHKGYSAQSSALHIREFAVGICRKNLPQEFAVGVWRGYLPFVFVSKSFSVYVSKSCLYVSKTFLFVRFSLLTVFLFVIAVAVMGHRRKHLILCLHFKQFQPIYTYNGYTYSKKNVVDNLYKTFINWKYWNGLTLQPYYKH